MARRPWWPATLADQVVLLNNFSLKIGTYATTLGWTPAQVIAAALVCAEMRDAAQYADASRATMQAVTQWRDLVFSGEPEGSPAMPIPVFPASPAFDATRGNLHQFMRLRDQILANNAYTEAIGQDLGLVGAEISPISPESVAPSLKITVTDGDTVNVAGSMQGMNAMKLVYTPTGGTGREVAFLTSTPAGFTITKTDPTKPENGELRAFFYKKNAPYGTPSPNYPITLS